MTEVKTPFKVSELSLKQVEELKHTTKAQLVSDYNALLIAHRRSERCCKHWQQSTKSANNNYAEARTLNLELNQFNSELLARNKQLAKEKSFLVRGLQANHNLKKDLRFVNFVIFLALICFIAFAYNYFLGAN